MRASAGRPRRLGAVDLVFGSIVAASVGQRLWLTQRSWFYLDDWPLVLRGRHLGDFVQPYNSHLSVVLLAIYRAHMELFGFRTYLPLRVAGSLSLAAVPIGVFLALRQGRGPAVAALVALPLVWFRHMSLEPAALNLYLAAAFGAGCAWALGRPSSRRHDLTVAVMLTLSLCSAGGGSAVAVACLVFAACTRAPRRRWVAVLVPTATWVLWWLRYSGGANPPITSDRLGASGLARSVATNLAGSFRQLALGNRAVGLVLAVAFVTWGVAVVGRYGVAGGAALLAWSAALVAWWFGLALSRGKGADVTGQFRYAYVAATFVALALAPTPGQPSRRRTGSVAGPDPAGAFQDAGPTPAAGAITTAAPGRLPGPASAGATTVSATATSAVGRSALLRIDRPADERQAPDPLAKVPSSAAAVVVLALAAVFALATHGDLQRSSDVLARAACTARRTVATVERGRAVVPDDAKSPITMYFVRAGQIRALTARYGHPFPPGQDDTRADGPHCP